MPVSGLSGIGLKDPIDPAICNWYSGLPFIQFIDELPTVTRKLDGPFIMPIVDKYKDMGTVVMGKVESGQVKKGQNLLVMPNRTQVWVDQLWSDDFEVTGVSPGENIKAKLKVWLHLFDRLGLTILIKILFFFLSSCRVLKKKMSHPALCYATHRIQLQLAENSMLKLLF